MQFYLGTYTGTGTDADPFRPLGTDGVAGWTAIDLRADCTVVTGRCLLALPDGSADPVGATVLGTNLAAVLTDPQTAAINTRLGTTLANGLTRRQAIQELLVNQGGTGRWKNITGELVGGLRRLRIYLGGVTVLDQPVVAGGANYAESFNKADSTTLGPDLTWTEVTNDTQVVSNAARPVATAGTNRNRAEHDCATDDNFAQFTSINLGETGTANQSAFCRYDSASDTSYAFRRQSGATLSAYVAQLAKIVTGTQTLLGAAQTVARAGVTTNEVVYISASGSTITGKLDGVTAHTLTDTSITTGKRGGFATRAGTSVVNAQIDNFSMGDLLISGAAALNGVGTIAATGTVTRLGDAALTGTGTIAATGTVTRFGAAALTGTGTLATTGTVTRLGDAALTGTGTVSASGTVTPASPPVTTTDCDHLNEDGGLALNEDGGIQLLEGCGTTGSFRQYRTILEPEGLPSDDEEELILILALV